MSIQSKKKQTLKTKFQLFPTIRESNSFNSVHPKPKYEIKTGIPIPINFPTVLKSRPAKERIVNENQENPKINPSKDKNATFLLL